MHLSLHALIAMLHLSGFNARDFDANDTRIHGVVGGKGPPLLLLHGWPQNLLEWHRVAPALANDFTVIATDLRGYGQSGKPPDGERHIGHCKRSMASDQVEVMRQLGFESFFVAGHDRGGRVAHRMALDFPNVVRRVAVIDIVPTLTVYSNVTKELATAYFHWFFLIQPVPVPESLLAGRGELLLRTLFRGLDDLAMPKETFDDYVRCFNDPATLHAMCEDYRAAAGIDLEHDRADLDRKTECPLLTLWGEHGAMHKMFDVLATWQERGTDVRGKPLPGGHWLPEQTPDLIHRELHEFFSI
jgi:haloacetate dehalogenase